MCQHPKPILLNTGGINFPAPWEPRILPLQIFRVGQLIIIGVPGTPKYANSQAFLT